MSFTQNVCSAANVFTSILCSQVYAYWLIHYVTSRKVVGSRPDEVTQFLVNLPNPPGCTVL
jgi:hypothetical protein